MMKSTSMLLLLALTASTNLIADQHKDHRKPDFDALASQLQLDQTHTEQLKEIMLKHRQQMETTRRQAQKTREMREQHREELLTVLNYEQLYRFEQYMRQFHRPEKLK